MRLSILFFLVLAILQFVSCSSNSNSGKSNNLIEDDSMYTVVDTIKYLFDTGDINEVNLSSKDENDVWFENKTMENLRIVYKADKKQLLIYINQKILKKYDNILGLNLKVNKELNFIIFTNKQFGDIVKISKNIELNPNSKLEYYYGKNKIYKAPYHSVKKIMEPNFGL